MSSHNENNSDVMSKRRKKSALTVPLVPCALPESMRRVLGARSNEKNYPHVIAISDSDEEIEIIEEKSTRPRKRSSEQIRYTSDPDDIPLHLLIPALNQCQNRARRSKTSEVCRVDLTLDDEASQNSQNRPPRKILEEITARQQTRTTTFSH